MYPVLAVVPTGWNQALNVCQWVHEHIAERVPGISTVNRFTDFVAVPPLSPLVHTEYVDNFVGLVQQESVARDAAERVSGTGQSRLACSPCHLLPREGDIRLGVRSSEAECWGVSPWALGLRDAMLCVASLGWATEDEISSLVGHFTFRALVRREPLAIFSTAFAFPQRGAASLITGWCNCCCLCHPHTYPKPHTQKQFTSLINIFDLSLVKCFVPKSEEFVSEGIFSSACCCGPPPGATSAGSRRASLCPALFCLLLTVPHWSRCAAESGRLHTSLWQTPELPSTLSLHGCRRTVLLRLSWWPQCSAASSKP